MTIDEIYEQKAKVTEKLNRLDSLKEKSDKEYFDTRNHLYKTLETLTTTQVSLQEKEWREEVEKLDEWKSHFKEKTYAYWKVPSEYQDELGICIKSPIIDLQLGTTLGIVLSVRMNDQNTPCEGKSDLVSLDPFLQPSIRPFSK